MFFPAHSQEFQTNYRDQYIYCFINNHTQRYFTQSPELPNHQLEIHNYSSTPVYVTYSIKVVLRRNGNYLDSKVNTGYIDIAGGMKKHVTSWMPTINKGNAYYCVEGFNILSVNPIQRNSESYQPPQPNNQVNSQTKSLQQEQTLSENQWKINKPEGFVRPYTIKKGIPEMASLSYALRHGTIVNIHFWKTIDGVEYGNTYKSDSQGNYLYIRKDNLSK